MPAIHAPDQPTALPNDPVVAGLVNGAACRRWTQGPTRLPSSGNPGVQRSPGPTLVAEWNSLIAREGRQGPWGAAAARTLSSAPF
jgi:hypothetical protein